MFIHAHVHLFLQLLHHQQSPDKNQRLSELPPRCEILGPVALRDLVKVVVQNPLKWFLTSGKTGKGFTALKILTYTETVCLFALAPACDTRHHLTYFHLAKLA